MNVMTNPAALRRRTHPAGLPDPGADHPRQELVFLDSAASAQKPRAVIDAMSHAMETQYANVHRGLHWMSERTTEAYEATRDAVAGLMHANDRSEIVFVRNSTEAINLLAHSYGRGVMKPGQAVLISGMEHHSNIVPWQLLRDSHGIELRVAPVTDAGELDMAAFEALLRDGKVGLVAITHMSNVLGTVTPAERIVHIAHAHGAKVMFDGSQAIVHRKVDVRALDCDFYVWTGHKLYGPTGIGVLWGWARAAGTDAPLPGRRRYDFVGDLRAVHLGRGAQSLRPAPQRSWKASASRRRSTMCRHRLRRHGGARGRPDRTRPRPARRHTRAAHSGGRRTAAA